MKLDKITKKSRAVSRRYNDACGAAHALDLAGERWALLVMRELLLGPKRFSDLRADLPGISANVLQQRLEGLEATSIVRRRKLPPPASAQVYELTDWGYQSEPIFQALGNWAARSPSHDPSLPISTVSVLLSFRTMFAPQLAKGVQARIGFHFSDGDFVAAIAAGRIEIARAPIDGADASFSGTAQALAAAVYGGQPLEGLEKQGALRVSGDRKLAKRFLGWFPLPDKAP